MTKVTTEVRAHELCLSLLACCNSGVSHWKNSTNNLCFQRLHQHSFCLQAGFCRCVCFSHMKALFVGCWDIFVTSTYFVVYHPYRFWIGNLLSLVIFSFLLNLTISRTNAMVFSAINTLEVLMYVVFSASSAYLWSCSLLLVVPKTDISKVTIGLCLSIVYWFRVFFFFVFFGFSWHFRLIIHIDLI